MALEPGYTYFIYSHLSNLPISPYIIKANGDGCDWLRAKKFPAKKLLHRHLHQLYAKYPKYNFPPKSYYTRTFSNYNYATIKAQRHGCV